MEEVLFESEERRTRSEAADLLRTVAARLDDDDPVTLSAGGESYTIEVPAELTLEVKAEREREGATSELSIEFELEWDENDGGGLSVE